jgi:hypothetical protein
MIRAGTGKQTDVAANRALCLAPGIAQHPGIAERWVGVGHGQHGGHAAGQGGGGAAGEVLFVLAAWDAQVGMDVYQSWQGQISHSCLRHNWSTGHKKSPIWKGSGFLNDLGSIFRLASIQAPAKFIILLMMGIKKALPASLQVSDCPCRVYALGLNGSTVGGGMQKRSGIVSDWICLGIIPPG